MKLYKILDFRTGGIGYVKASTYDNALRLSKLVACVPIILGARPCQS